MKLLTILSVFILILTSCNLTKNIKSESVFIRIEKTMCKGKCPVYKMEILQNGEVYFKGIQNIEPIGVYSKKLSNNELIYIKSIFNSSNFYSFKDEYDFKATDLPSVYLSYQQEGKELKKIKARQDYPDELTFLIGELDKIVTDGNWNLCSDTERLNE